MANKTLHKGEWRLITPRGKLGDPCPPFQQGEDSKWIADGAFGDFVRVLTDAEKDAKSQLANTPRPPPQLPKLGSKAYRVVTQTDKWFMGKFDPERLEELLNELGSQGWGVVGVTASDRGTWFGSFAGGMRQEMVILLERTVDEAFILEVRRRRGEVHAATVIAPSG